MALRATSGPIKFGAEAYKLRRIWNRLHQPVSRTESDPKRANGGVSDAYFYRERKGMTGERGSDSIRSSASQMGQHQTSLNVPRSLKGSACSTRLCVVHFAVGKPFRPVPWSSSIIFGVPAQLRGCSLYPRGAIRLRTLSKRKLEDH